MFQVMLHSLLAGGNWGAWQHRDPDSHRGRSHKNDASDHLISRI
jgi:hypothetical protein